jgi:hypothetical protein
MTTGGAQCCDAYRRLLVIPRPPRRPRRICRDRITGLRPFVEILSTAATERTGASVVAYAIAVVTRRQDGGSSNPAVVIRQG